MAQANPAMAIPAEREATTCSHRDERDDFFCLRYRVWYPSSDCAYRTKFRTCPGCFDCDQGRFNLKRHHPTLRSPSALPVVE